MSNVRKLNEVFDTFETRLKPLSERLVITNRLEDELDEIIDLVRPDLFLEVGAFDARFSRKMKRKFPNVPAIALEANPRVYNNFYSQAAIDGVDYRNCAATSKRETVKIHIPEQIAGKKMPEIGSMGSLLEVGLRDSRTISVEVMGMPIDDILQEHSFENACAWIDVEGFTDQVLLGGRKTIDKCSIIFVELESSPVWKGQVLADEIIHLLDDSGFEYVARDCQKWFQFNAVFLRHGMMQHYKLEEKIDAFTEFAVAEFESRSP